MNCKKLLALMLVMVFAFSMSVFATEEGENEFFLNWSSTDELPLTLWEAKVLPDFNSNGRSELFLAADGDAGGAVYYVVEATANDEWEVLWEYFVEDCNYSYTLNNTTEGADLDMDGLPELLLGVKVDAGSGLPGLYIFELDTTFAKDENGSYTTYPFPADFPTSVFDVNGNSGSPTCIFTGQLDTDPETELVIGETHEDIVWVLEETGGDLGFPIFEVEYTDTLVYSPWGYYKGDLEYDGQTDFGVGSSDFNSIRLYENVAGTEDAYDKVIELHVDDDVDGYTNRGIAAVDINGDGLGELIYVRYTSPGKVYAIANPGEIALIDDSYIGTIFTDPDSGRLVGAATGDRDHGFGSDGKDIYFASRDGQTVYDLEYVGETGEGIDPATAVDPANYDTYALYTTDQRMQDIEVADFDRDGEGEVAIIYAGGADAHKLEVIEHGTLPDAGFEIMWHDVADTTHLIDPVHGNPRGIFAGSDVDQDGKKEIIATEYNGKFHVYEVVSDNVIEWVW
ncbi:hypothetical protein KAH55_05095, partial [bacterium]|nr:hypothetical protein [bacterium]